MNIVSLLPATTEIVYALGLGDQLAGVSHLCDFPDAASTKPQVTRGSELDEALLASLAPELILTAELGEDPVVAYDTVIEVAARLPGSPRVAAFDPDSIETMFQAIHDISWLASHPERGRDLVASLQERLDDLANRLEGVAPKRVLCIRGAEDSAVAEGWVPEMVWRAGGIAVWEGSDIIVVIPREHEPQRGTTPSGRIHFTEQPVLFTRPGPRLIDGIETLAAVLYPERVD